MINRAGQVWEHEDGEIIYVVEPSQDAGAYHSWWTTFSLHNGRWNPYGTHTTHFEDWEHEPSRGWARLA